MPASLSNLHLTGLKNTSGYITINTLLQSYSLYPLTSPAVIKKYHDLLLYYAAFPYNKKMAELANDELRRIAATVKSIYAGSNTRAQLALMGSGIAHTPLISAFSSTLAYWLINKFPGQAGPGGSNAPAETVRNTIQALTPGIEYEKSSQGECSLAARLKNMSGLQAPAASLHWLLQLFAESNLPELAKEELYRQLDVFIRWQPADELYSRSFLRLPVTKTWYQKRFIKKISSRKIVMEKLSSPLPLSLPGKEWLIDTMKATLAFQSRETDPVTYADSSETVLFDMGRGLLIALSGMEKKRRLSLESYIGFMAFKNGIPVSYGGGWLWGQRCKIGVNIFPPFRKGESAWLFCQVMRVYYQYFGARLFTVSPYQFGRGNPEGLKSGAFWFYYKLGFRPAKEAILQEAAGEWQKISTEKGYRTPLPVLRRFTDALLEWNIDGEAFPSFDAASVSAAITRMINSNFDSSRKQAVGALSKRMKKLLPPAFIKNGIQYQQEMEDNWSLLCGLLTDLPQWSAVEKKKLARLLRLKQTAKEREYVAALQQHRRLWQSLALALR